MGNSINSGKSTQPNRVSNIFWAVFAIALGAYEVLRPEASRLLRVTGWVVITLGVGSAISILLCWRIIARCAKRIDQINRQIYGGVHRYREVNESTIVSYGLDAGFYQRTTESLEHLGFRRLMDIVDMDVEQSLLRIRTVIRTFLSSDGTTMGGVYDVRLGGGTRLPPKNQVTDFETELNDGTFVTTSDSPYDGKSSEFPGITRMYLPPGVSTSDLWAAHIEHLRRELAGRRDGVAPVVLWTYDELRKSQDRLQLLKCAHRNSAMYDPAKEVARIVEQPLTTGQQVMADEIARLHRERVEKVR